MSDSDTSFPLRATPCFCIEQAVLYGFDPDEVLAGTGLNQETYARPKTLLNQAQEFAIYDNVLRLFATEDIGLRLGGLITINSFGLASGLVANSIDVAHAGYLTRRFHALSNYWFTSDLLGELVPGKFVVRYRQTTELGHLYPMLIDLTVRTFQRLLIDVYGAEAGFYLDQIALGYPAPRNVDYYQREFACPVSFGHEFTTVTLNKEVGKLVNVRRSEFTYRVCLQYCRDSAFDFSALTWKNRVLNILACTDNFHGLST